MAASMDGNSSSNLTIIEAKAAMADIMAAFEEADNAARIKKARDSAGNDMLKAMQIVFPVTTQIEMDVIKKYGFSADGEGVIQFAQAVRSLSSQDADLAELNSRLRAFIIPQMGAPTPAIQDTS